MRFGAKSSDKKESKTEPSLSAAGIMKGFALAAGAALSWSLGAPLIKMGMLASGLDPIELTFYRSAMPIFLSWTIRFVIVRRNPSLVMPLPMLPSVTWLYFLGAGYVGPYSRLYSQRLLHCRMPVAIVTAITSTCPFMAAMFCHFVLKDRLAKLQWVGVVMIIVGSIVISV
ncbi:MAG: DMT family transporter [Synergistaceae bacterium]